MDLHGELPGRGVTLEIVKADDAVVEPEGGRGRGGF